MKSEKFVKPDEVIIELIRAGLIELPTQTKFGVSNSGSQDEILKETARVQALYLRALRAELARQNSDD